ncbi:MAG: hypothetical protein KDA24_25985 [Deltaproteobacteria bacterium]|nr:hypothetical protein [Deltaproteobacteria bacterium]
MAHTSSSFRPSTLLALGLVAGCAGTGLDDTGPDTSTADTGVDSEAPRPDRVTLTVTLDGVPEEGVVVLQGGLDVHHLTDASGEVVVDIDWDREGDIALLASHPDARIGLAVVREALERIDLESFDASDNADYIFDAPGVAGAGTAAFCGHCHVTFTEEFTASPHATSASNPVVHDLYAGVARALDEADCGDAGGVWKLGTAPGGAGDELRCYVGRGVLPDLNPGCTDCEDQPAQTGACADCHAPGIDGSLGGRDLLDARETSHESGVHCDVCHKVESVDLDAPAGVAGRLKLMRPSEPDAFQTGYVPLTFGPLHDVPNPRMGAVQREHFRSKDFCAGCHQLDQPALIPGQSLDAQRWPEATLPIHSTYEELGSSTQQCQDCHMPLRFDLGNGADLENIWNIFPGIAGGWLRPDGVASHRFPGPRAEESGFLESAAGLAVSKSVANGTLTAQVTVSSTRPPHAFPTGEPLRHLLLRVQARCDVAPLAVSGGDVVPDYGGALETKVGGDFTRWEDARPGDVVRVVSRPGGFVEYTGFGPFGDGRFSTSEKGLAVEAAAGEVVVTAVDAGVASFDGPLPAGDVAYLSRSDGLPVAGEPAGDWAGASGWGFARVLADAEGERMVPHHRAVDIVSDNRLLAFQGWTSTHEFDSPCAEPEVEAVLVYRPYPWDLAGERGWAMTERVAASGVF